MLKQPSKKYSVRLCSVGVLSTALFLSGCSGEAPNDEATSDAVASQSELSLLESRERVIRYQIDSGPENPWTITPELSPDTLKVPCTEGSETKVRFASDLGELTFTLSGYDIADFDVLFDESVAKTRVACAPPRLRFPGDYGVDAPLSERDLRAELNAGTLDSHIQEMVEARKIPGLAVVVVQGKETLFEEFYGVEEIASGEAITRDSSLRLASATKVLSGLLFLSAAEEGIIDLNATIGESLADAPEAWREIPLWRILNHTSGLPLISQPAFEELTEEERAALSHREVFDLLKDLPLDFEPGSSMRYQQSAYSILAMILSERTEKSWSELLEEHVFRPALMSQTLHGDSLGEHPASYRLDRGELQVEEYYYPEALSMGGGYNTTAEDMANLFKALNAGEIVGRDFLLSQIFDEARLPDGNGYSLATTAKTIGEHQTIGHSGGGGLADIRYAPEAEIGIGVFSSRGGSDFAFDVTDEIAGVLFGHAPR